MRNFCKLLAFSGTIIAPLAGVYAQKEKPNFLIILVDDFGWADLGCYGSSFYETPNIDRLASQGIRFTNGYASAPVSSPTRACLQTGQYANRTGITDWLPGRGASVGPTPPDRWIAAKLPVGLNPQKATIAEILKGAGYVTFFAGKWHLGETEDYWPEHQGYNINKGGCAFGSPNINAKNGFKGYFSPYGNPRLEDGPEGEYLPDRLTAETIHFLETKKDKPFFAILSFYLVHNPTQAKPEVIAKYQEKRKKMGLNPADEMILNPEWAKFATTSSSYKERIVQGNPIYAAMVQALDENVGRLMEQMKALGLDKNTVVVFTSDNGGVSQSEGSNTSNLPLRGSKGWLYEGGIRVPYIFRYPSMKNQGSVNTMPISSIDLFPTILSFAGIRPSPADTIDGINIRPFLEKTRYPDRALFWDYPHYSNQGGNPGSVIRKGKYKLIHDYETGKLELYDLENDISEKNDLSDKFPEIRDRLFAELKAWRRATNSKIMLPNPLWNHADPVVDQTEF